MKKSRFVSLSLTLAISIGLLTGCGKSTDAEVVEEAEPVVVMIQKELEIFENKPEDKIYEPYEHVFFYRYYTGNAENVMGGVITVPDGYEILQINNYNEYVSDGSESKGFDVWFTNNESVKVAAVYNERKEYYEYCQAGEVIITETELEDSMTLTK